MICRAMLEANGYSVLTALGAEAGLEILKENEVNAAVIDDGLREIDAASLARKMRNCSPRLAIVVFMRASYPAYAMSETEIYVPKSSGPKALLAAIVKACKGDPGMHG